VIYDLILIQKASASNLRSITPQQLKGDFRIHADDLSEFIKKANAINKIYSREVFNEGDQFNVYIDVVEVSVIDNHVEGISMIAEI